MTFVRFSWITWSLILRGYAVIYLPFVPARVEFGYSTHVSTFLLQYFSLLNVALFSHVLWEHNRAVVGLTVALLLANTGCFIYSLCLSLPGAESPDACRQMRPFLAVSKSEICARSTILWIPELLSSPNSPRTSCFLFSSSSASCAGKKLVRWSEPGGCCTQR